MTAFSIEGDSFDVFHRYSVNHGSAFQMSLAYSAIVRSLERGFNFSNCARSVTQPSPMASVMTAAGDGLASNSQRRGLTPLVLLLKRSGNIAAKSGTTRCFSNSECSAATPLVLCEPTMRGSESALFRRSYEVKMPDFMGKSTIICLTRFN